MDVVQKTNIKTVSDFVTLAENQQKKAEQLIFQLKDDSFTDKDKWENTWGNFRKNEKIKLDKLRQFRDKKDKLNPNDKRKFENIDSSIKQYVKSGYNKTKYDAVKKDTQAISFLEGEAEMQPLKEKRPQKKKAAKAEGKETGGKTESEDEKEEEKPTETEATKTEETESTPTVTTEQALGFALEQADPNYHSYILNRVGDLGEITNLAPSVTESMRESAQYLKNITDRLGIFARKEYPDILIPSVDVLLNLELKQPNHQKLKEHVSQTLNEYFQNRVIQRLTDEQLDSMGVVEDDDNYSATSEEEKEKAKKEEEEALREGGATFSEREKAEAKELAEDFAAAAVSGAVGTLGSIAESAQMSAESARMGAERAQMSSEDMPPLPPPPIVPATTQPKTGAPEIINRDLSRTQPGTQAGMPQAMGAMGSAVQATDAEQQRVATMTIKEVKARIKALHDAYDGLIPSLTTDQHKKNKERAMKTKNADEAKSHLLEMLKLIREYFAGPLGGLTVGVVIPAQDYLRALMGTMGKDGDCGCKHDDEEHKHEHSLDDPVGTIYDPPGTRPPEDNTAPGKPHPGDVLKDRHGHDSFGHTYMVANHYRNSGIDRTKGVAGYEARTVFDQPKFMRPVEKPSYPNMPRDQIRFYANRRPRGMVPGLKIPT